MTQKSPSLDGEGLLFIIEDLVLCDTRSSGYLGSLIPTAWSNGASPIVDFRLQINEWAAA